MNKVSKVVHNLIPESFIPGRIQRLNTLMNILPIDNKQSLTVNEIVERHISALGLSKHTQDTALRILRRDLGDLQNEGQIQSVSCRPKRFFKTSPTNALVGLNAYGGIAANDDNASATLCSLSLARRIIFSSNTSMSSVSDTDKKKINAFLEIIKLKQKADFFYLSKADERKSIKPINVSTNVVGIIVKSTGIFVVKATLSRNIELFDVQGITELTSIRRPCNALNKDDDAESVMQIALSMTNAQDVSNPLAPSKPCHKQTMRK